MDGRQGFGFRTIWFQSADAGTVSIIHLKMWRKKRIQEKINIEQAMHLKKKVKIFF